jgi:hypothetical protein
MVWMIARLMAIVLLLTMRKRWRPAAMAIKRLSGTPQARVHLRSARNSGTAVSTVNAHRWTAMIDPVSNSRQSFTLALKSRKICG